MLRNLFINLTTFYQLIIEKITLIKNSIKYKTNNKMISTVFEL